MCNLFWGKEIQNIRSITQHLSIFNIVSGGLVCSECCLNTFPGVRTNHIEKLNRVQLVIFHFGDVEFEALETYFNTSDAGTLAEMWHFVPYRDLEVPRQGFGRGVLDRSVVGWVATPTNQTRLAFVDQTVTCLQVRLHVRIWNRKGSN